MKKTLVALAVTAFAASASAVTVYENEGTKVETYGQLRLLLDNSGTSKKVNGKKETTKSNHTNLKNDGSRLGMQIKHDINEDLSAFGRFELRFNGTNTKVDKDTGEVEADNTADSFGSVYAHRAYVGLISKTFGELMFGRQAVIGDDIAQAGFDKTYGVKKTPLVDVGKSVIRYDYKGIKGLQLSADYRFAEKRYIVNNINNGEKAGEVEVGELKSGYDVGAVYKFDVTDGQSMTVAAGYSRNNFVTGTSEKHHYDAAMAGASYTIGGLKVALDYGYYIDKDGSVKTKGHTLHTGAKYNFTPAVAVYGNYVYGTDDVKNASITTSKTKHHRFMLGTEYQMHKHVVTFLEGSVKRATKTAYSNGVAGTKTRTTDKSIGAGLRVVW